MKFSEETRYLDLLHRVSSQPLMEDRTGTGTHALYGESLKFDLDPFPVIRGKKVLVQPLFTELEWFIQGKTDVKYLVDRGCNIWTPWALERNAHHVGNLTLSEYKRGILDGTIPEEFTELGPIYGKQWRDFQGQDQLANVVESLRKNPHGRRHIVSSWNVPSLSEMALPPCHLLYQFHVGPVLREYVDPLQKSRAESSGMALHLTMYQRSADLFLGVPFNISSYAALAHWMSMMSGYPVGTLTMFFGNAHVYSNHRDAISIYTDQVQTLDKSRPNHVLDVSGSWNPSFSLTGYDHAPFIPAPVAV